MAYKPVPVPGREGWFQYPGKEPHEGWAHKERRLRQEALDAANEHARKKLCPFIKTPTGYCVGSDCMAFQEVVNVMSQYGYSMNTGQPMGPLSSLPTGQYRCTKAVAVPPFNGSVT